MIRRTKSVYRRGFSLVEVVIVIVIIGVLGIIGIGVGGKQIQSTRITATSNSLQILANEIENTVLDNGFLKYDEITDTETVKSYFRLWDENYLSAALKWDSPQIIAQGTNADEEHGSFGFGDYAGVVLDTIKYKDPWDNEYKVLYLVDSADNYMVVVASRGPNSKYSPDIYNGYLADGANFDDDIAIIMEPRG